MGQSLVFQVAKKASVLKRRKSRNRMEANVSGARTETNTPGPGTPLADAPGQIQGGNRALSDTDMQGFYSEEGKG